jgi:glyoxylase-like metal-dependent hydrolase (beta-lactamase superfamily II)
VTLHVFGGAGGVTVLGRGTSWVDLEHLGDRNVIAAVVMSGGGALALIDPGPSTSLENLDRGLQRQGLRLSDVTHVLLTHIHLDHAGGTGILVRRNPAIRVFVHERGAPHMADPERLIASAARLYGDRMERLWGEIAPVPEKNLTVLAGGERLEVGDRTLDVAYTPGHASHHVSFFDRSAGIAFVGDAGGVRIDGGYVFPPTNPPEVDLDRWRESVQRIEAWSPQTLFLTHFGPVHPVAPHLQALIENLETLAGVVRDLLAGPGADEEKLQRFADYVERELQRRPMTAAQRRAYSRADPIELAWLGLVRYWRKRGPA